MAFDFSIGIKTAAPLSQKTGAVWHRIAEAVLGKEYDLSVALIGNALSNRLNREHRGKDTPTNVLAFPLTEKSGEIYINVPYSRAESADFGRKPKEHLTALFMHGLLHLKGFDHGSRMEKEELRLVKKYIA